MPTTWTNAADAQANALAELDRLAPVLDRVSGVFGAAGYEVYLVGGPVRDALLGRSSVDLDFTTSARPDVIERLLRTLTKRTWDMGREFGTIGAMVAADGIDYQVEVTTFRADAYDAASRKPIVAFGDSITDDLRRRDFTVNAMAIRLPERVFIDPYGGFADLATGSLRTPSTPEVSFSDDPLRMLRAARFAARLGLVPDPDVVAAMTAMAERITIVSAERIRDELTKLLLCDEPRVGLNLLVETGLADHFLPELPALRLEADEHHRHKDVYEHSLTVLDQAIALEKARGHAPDLVNRPAALTVCIACLPDDLPGSGCDDGDACTTDDKCQKDGAGCAGTAITCDDGIACTADSCDPLQGCIFEPDCPDGTVCDVVQGTCVEGSCEANCNGKECGDDGCGSPCGWCSPGAQCSPDGQCLAK